MAWGISALISLLECRCPIGYGPPGPNPLADMAPLRGFGPPKELSENIILKVLVEIDNTLRFSAY